MPTENKRQVRFIRKNGRVIPIRTTPRKYEGRYGEQAAIGASAAIGTTVYLSKSANSMRSGKQALGMVQALKARRITNALSIAGIALSIAGAREARKKGRSGIVELMTQDAARIFGGVGTLLALRSGLGALPKLRVYTQKFAEARKFFFAKRVKSVMSNTGGMTPIRGLLR